MPDQFTSPNKKRGADAISGAAISGAPSVDLFRSPSKRQATGVDKIFFVIEASKTLFQRGYQKSDGAEEPRTVFMCAQLNDGRLHYLSFGARQVSLVATLTGGVGRWMNIAGIQPTVMENCPEVIWCVDPKQKPTASLCLEQHETPGRVLDVSAGVSKNLVDGLTQHATVMCGIVSLKKFTTSSGVFHQYTVGYGNLPHISTATFLCASSNPQFAIDEVYLVGNVCMTVFQSEKQLKIATSSGFFSNSARWTPEMQQWKKDFKASMFSEPLKITNVADIINEVKVFQFSINGNLDSRTECKVEAYLIDFLDGPLTRIACSECGRKWQDDMKTCPSGLHQSASPYNKFHVEAQVGAEAEYSLTTSLLKPVQIYNEVFEQLYTIKADQYCRLTNEEKGVLYSTHFEKKYDMIIEVKSATSLFPKLTIKSITLAK